ncbi:MAG TPA: EF-hand domain-containing protein [Planctomycetaceae bacterium]|nr:EF-hand domain-containing protein [Planctomycetaceae bacterium]
MKKMLMCLLGVGMSVSLLTTGFAQEKKNEEKKPEKKKPDPAAVFKRLDKDGDSKVTKEEFVASRKTDEAKKTAETQFARRDKNKDGSLSLEEFTATPTKKKPGEKKPE